MYRQYENPHDLQMLLKEAEFRLAEAGARDDLDAVIDLHNEVESLKERINFAWQDIEYDEMY